MRLVKRLSLLSFLGVLVCLHTDAQDNFYEQEPKVFEGGLIMGMNFSQIDGDTYYGYHKVGLTAGGVVYVHLSSSFGVSMELLYSQKGSRGENVVESPIIGTYVTKYYMNVNYMEVPLTLHIAVRRFDFEGGLSYARLLKSSEWVQSDVPVIIDEQRNHFKTSDINYVFGLGGRVYKKFHANIRFQYSLNSIRSPDRIPIGYGYGNLGQFNNLFSLRVIYFF